MPAALLAPCVPALAKFEDVPLVGRFRLSREPAAFAQAIAAEITRLGATPVEIPPPYPNSDDEPEWPDDSEDEDEAFKAARAAWDARTDAAGCYCACNPPCKDRLGKHISMLLKQHLEVHTSLCKCTRR